MKMTIVLTVSPWAISGDKHERAWSGPPRSDGPNTAARVEKTGVCWPFARWEWSVWSPFAEDGAADGSATTLDGAKTAADRALADLILSAEQATGGDVPTDTAPAA